MTDPEPDDEEVTLTVPEMDCPSCADTVERALSGVDGVVDAAPQPTQGLVTIRLVGGADTDAAVAAVERAGYEVASVGGDGALEPRAVWTSRRGKLTAASGLFLLAGVAVAYVLTGLDARAVTLGVEELSVSELLLIGGIVAGGSVILRNGLYSLRARALDIDLLMSAAILAAVGGSLAAPDVELYVEAASLAALFNVAELLEQHSVDRARGSRSELLELAPDTATVERDGERVEVPVETVESGEVVFVEPGEKVAVDGTVVDGESAVDEAPITGESVPVDKAEGAEVYAGSINGEGFLAVEATAAGNDTTLSRVLELVEQAEASDTRHEQFVDRFAGYYTPVVLAAAVLAATVPPLLFARPWDVWLVRGIAFLVIACPCAFVISTPVSVVSGITSAARNGVLVKAGSHLEAMAGVDTVAFDKTGTLTKGELAVTDVVPAEGSDERAVLRAAFGLERRSEHPIGEAIVEHARERDVEPPAIDGFESITGKGVRAEFDGTIHYAGKPGLFEELGFDLDRPATDGGPVDGAGTASDGGAVGDVEATAGEDLAGAAARLQRDGKTVVLIGTEERLLGVIAVADEVRPEAATAVEALRERGVEPMMLTGDSEGTARAVAAAVGIERYRAELLPEGKVEAVEELEAEGDVAMVGDGINDAPALATATVGVAMGAAGTDTAIETADVALLGDDLRKVPYLHRLSDTATRVIRGNIFGSLAVKAALAVGIPLGYVSVVLAVLAGDVGMTVLVTGNAARLARVRP
jgi:Cd2+/Zn2+-exporting ATPase